MENLIDNKLAIIDAMLMRQKLNIMQVKKIIIILSGAIGAVIGSEIAMTLNARELKKYFGILLLLISANEIYRLVKEYILSKKTHNN